MKNNRPYLVIALIFIVIGVYVLVSTSKSKLYSPDYMVDDYYIFPTKTHLVNEYKPINVSEEDMVKNYFNTYVLLMIEDEVSAYNHLETEYRDTYYRNIDVFREHVKKITFDYSIVPTMNKYRITSYNGKKMYSIIDKNNNEYIFIIDAVMKYNVYFDKNML